MKQALIFFEKAIKNNRLAHLYLISGPKGSKKQDLTLEIAKRLLNRENEIDFDEKFRAGNIVNVFVIEKEGQVIKKEQIQDLQTEFSKTALVSGKRIFIIKNIESISLAAANSLLKFLEEPESEETFGLLLTENIDDVLLTIKSRSQIVHLKSINEKAMTKVLLEAGLAENIAVVAPYITKDIAEAKALVEDEEFLNLLDIFEQTINVITTGDDALTLFFAKNRELLIANRSAFKNFVELLILFFLDIIYYKMNQEVTYSFLEKEITNYSNKHDSNEINEIINKLQSIIMELNYFINLDLTIEKIAHILN